MSNINPQSNVDDAITDPVKIEAIYCIEENREFSELRIERMSVNTQILEAEESLKTAEAGDMERLQKIINEGNNKIEEIGKRIKELGEVKQRIIAEKIKEAEETIHAHRYSGK